MQSSQQQSKTAGVILAFKLTLKHHLLTPLMPIPKPGISSESLLMKIHMTLPNVEATLQDLLGETYVDEHWQPALTAVMNAEGDSLQASEAVERYAEAATHHVGLTLKIPARPSQQGTAEISQLTCLEEALAKSIEELKNQNHIFGPTLSVDKLLTLPGENEIGDSEYRFEGGDEAITAEAKWQLAVEHGKVIEVDSDLDEADGNSEEPAAPGWSRAELMQMCEELEAAYIAHSDANLSLQLP